MDWDLIFSILKILSGPVIGMVIGYFTNFLAVKMLFRPLYPKKIGKWKLPFTPGVIPARKDALARSMGAVVSQELFTSEDLGKLINSQEVEDLLVTRVLEGISAGAAGKNLSQVITSAVGEETYVDTREKVFETALTAICQSVEDLKVGALVGGEVKNYIESLVAGSTMLGWVLTKERTARIAEQFAERLDEFLSENLEFLVAPCLAGEIEKVEMLSMENVSISEDLVRRLVHNLFRVFTTSCLPDLLVTINIGKTVEEKIAAMDAKDLERMVLSVMKKELRAVVNLGAVLGFLIGIVNIFI